MKQRDRETRERLLRAAAQLFADRGFKKVTVRDICRGGPRQRRRRQLPLRRQERAVSRGAAARHRHRARDERGGARGRRGPAGRGAAAALHPRSRCAASRPSGHADWIAPADPPRDRRSDARVRRAGRPGHPPADRRPVGASSPTCSSCDAGRRTRGPVRREHPLAVDPVRDAARWRSRLRSKFHTAQRQPRPRSPSTSPTSRWQGFRRWRGAPARMGAERFSCR